MRGDDLVLADHLVVQPVAGGVERHELDEPHLDVVVAAEPGEVDDLVVVDTALDDGVDLHRREPGLLRRLDAVEHPPSSSRRVICSNFARSSVSRLMLTRSRPASRNSWASRRNVAPLVVIDRSGFCPAYGDAESAGTRSCASLLHEHRQVGADGRLATGEPQAVDLEALDEDARQPLDLLEREHLAARQPLHALFRHAVGAAEVAAVGDRDAQVANGASEGVDQVHRVTLPTAAACVQGAPAATPSPSGTSAMALAIEVAASWWLPWAPTDRTCTRPSAPNSANTRM